jgi:Spy/CpxP family protein refolding chaperone
MKRTRIVMAIAASLVSAAALAHWDGSNPGHGPGSGMMGGPGMGMGPGGTGMGPGGAGMGPGGAGMGPGGPGMGPGGAGMGPGGMGMGPGACGGAGRGMGFGAGLELTDEQRAKIADIQRETHADAHKRIEAVLTEEQKQKLGKAGPGPHW